MTSGRPITEDDLQAYVDDALDRHRRVEVEDWLSRHPESAERLAQDIAIRDQLRAALSPIVDEPAPAELNLERLIERHGRKSSSWSFPLARIAAALVLVVAGAGAGWMLRGATLPLDHGVVALTKEAVDSYAVFAPDTGRPVEISASNAPQFVEWASQRLARRVSIPDLSRSGFTFIGGRVVPTPHGPAVLYLFDDGKGTRLGLLARNMARDQNAPMSSSDSGAVNTMTWAVDGLGYSLVGPLKPSTLRPIANAARAQFGART